MGHLLYVIGASRGGDVKYVLDKELDIVDGFSAPLREGTAELRGATALSEP